MHGFHRGFRKLGPQYFLKFNLNEWASAASPNYLGLLKPLMLGLIGPYGRF